VLHYALRGSPGILQLLLENGYRPTQRWNPDHMAAFAMSHGAADHIRMLMEYKIINKSTLQEFRPTASNFIELERRQPGATKLLDLIIDHGPQGLQRFSELANMAVAAWRPDILDFLLHEYKFRGPTQPMASGARFKISAVNMASIADYIAMEEFPPETRHDDYMERACFSLSSSVQRSVRKYTTGHQGWMSSTEHRLQETVCWLYTHPDQAPNFQTLHQQRRVRRKQLWLKACEADRIAEEEHKAHAERMIRQAEEEMLRLADLEAENVNLKRELQAKKAATSGEKKREVRSSRKRKRPENEEDPFEFKSPPAPPPRQSLRQLLNPEPAARGTLGSTSGGSGSSSSSPSEEADAAHQRAPKRPRYWSAFSLCSSSSPPSLWPYPVWPGSA
jgi:hypothetical protein